MTADIELWRGNLLDLDILVDDKRTAVNRAVDELHDAVRERDRAAQHLAHLIDAALHSGAAQPAA